MTAESIDSQMDDNPKDNGTSSSTPAFARFFGGPDSLSSRPPPPPRKPDGDAEPAAKADSKGGLSTTETEHVSATGTSPEPAASANEQAASSDNHREGEAQVATVVDEDEDEDDNLGAQSAGASPLPSTPPPRRTKRHHTVSPPKRGGDAPAANVSGLARSGAPPPPPPGPATSAPPPPPPGPATSAPPPPPPGQTVSAPPPPPVPPLSAPPVPPQAKSAPPPPPPPLTSAPPPPPIDAAPPSSPAAPAAPTTESNAAQSSSAVASPPETASSTEARPASATVEQDDLQPDPPQSSPQDDETVGHQEAQVPDIRTAEAVGTQPSVQSDPEAAEPAPVAAPGDDAPTAPMASALPPAPPESEGSAARGSQAPPGASLPPPPVPPSPSGQPLYGESTAGYDEDVTQLLPAKHKFSSQAKLGSSGGAPAIPGSDAPASATFLSRKNVQLGIGAALAIAIAIGVLASLSGTGKLLVAVSAPNGAAVDKLKVFLDKKVVCKDSPCVKQIEAGNYLLSIEAEGFTKTAPVAIKVESGEDTVHEEQLKPEGGEATAGLEVLANGPGLTLSIDGEPVGTLPQKLSQLQPGPHTVKVEGGDRYQPQEKSITLLDGQVLTLQPFLLKVKKGQATIEAGQNAANATVLLDGRAIKLPYVEDLDPSTPHKLVATRKGFHKYESSIEFEPGSAERSFRVELEPEEPAEDSDAADSATSNITEAKKQARSAPASRKPTKKRGTAAKPTKKATAKKATAKKGTKAKLNLNSQPGALVILDGRPIGRTPKNGVQVSPGTHTVVFVSSKGRKKTSAKVAAGESKSVSVKF